MTLVAKREHVTPELAAKYLEANGKNRRLDRGRVAGYADQMRRGQWRETHQGIAFNCDGSLRDGQHRLAAIVESKVPTWFHVFRGLADEAVEVIDTHKGRSIADAMTISGDPVGKVMVSTARMMLTSYGMESAHSRADVIAFIRRHREPIAFAINVAGGARGLAAGILAPIARAWYTQDRQRLAEFGDCLKTGVVASEEDSAAATLVRAMNSAGPGGRNAFRGGSGRRMLYRKAGSALVAFLAGRPLSKLYAAAEEPFPIPE
jgi:hypothetical protein